MNEEDKKVFLKICLDNEDLFMGIIKLLPKEKNFCGSITEHFEKNGKIRFEKREFLNLELSTVC